MKKNKQTMVSCMKRKREIEMKGGLVEESWRKRVSYRGKSWSNGEPAGCAASPHPLEQRGYADQRHRARMERSSPRCKECRRTIPSLFCHQHGVWCGRPWSSKTVCVCVCVGRREEQR